MISRKNTISKLVRKETSALEKLESKQEAEISPFDQSSRFTLKKSATNSISFTSKLDTFMISPSNQKLLSLNPEKSSDSSP